MTTPIPGVSAPATGPASTSVSRGDQMGKDVFLKLLVAQMRYQDPSNPTSSSEFMAQTATFTQVEKLEEIAAQNKALVGLQRSLSAGALVGHQVTYTDTTGETRTGVVSAVRIAGTGAETEPQAVVDGVTVPLGRVTAVTLPTATTPGATQPTA
ncbi:flagellar hook capping FlgD N-terminal domain-containing protein [Modestobacter roseus]|uniref:Flagellar basal-body rod modification protein FlgD n=1 Tax=Modestobacter roseus TaxID=1181884 RepID=A0A562IKR3_9ACTN|nr:flagellar hook capping FlgD N-terminal domain-containing protein [Modestobacter roseus]MQA34542.1 flagellar hook capping protein [Modestobacter roseus]TWH71599.1 flagellar basal-body rod modification protein FlgD [Modestobacter roseus]